MTPVALFAGLPDADVAAILGLATLRRFRPGANLCRQGEQARSMFLLRTGRLRFVRGTRTGQEVIMRWLGPGDCFGMGSLMAGPAAYMGTAQAVDEGRAYEWKGDDFRDLAVRYPRLSQNALAVVLRYFKDYGDRHMALLSVSAEQRLARTLTTLGASAGRVLPSGVEIDITNRDLGSLADVGLYTVSRQLRVWARDGHLVKQRNRILVRRPESLLRE